MSMRKSWPVALVAVGVAALLVIGNLSEPAGDLARFLFIAIVVAVVVLGVVGAVLQRLPGRRATPSGRREHP